MRLAEQFSRARGASIGCGCCSDIPPASASPVSALQPVPVAGGRESGGRFRELDVSLPDIQFSAAHFVASKGFREHLHGHNYSVRVRLGANSSQLQQDGYIVDFGDVKRSMRAACAKLKGRTLVPVDSDVLQMQETEGQLDILCEDGCRFSIPVQDCAMLPIVHSTAEELSEYLWHELVGTSKPLGEMLQGRGVEWLEVGVYERPGQGATFWHELRPRDSSDQVVASPRGKSIESGVPGVTSSSLISNAKTSNMQVAPTAGSLGFSRKASAWDSIELAEAGDRAVEISDAAFQNLIETKGPRVAAEAAYRGLLLAALGVQEAGRPELVKTPARAAKAFFEINSGLALSNPLDSVGEGVFDLADSRRDVVSVRDVQFHSLCEHHLLPFSGRAHFAYIPDGKILGLSKFSRLLDAYARRPQVQERLTRHVAEALVQLLKPRAVAVMLEANHACMSIRGVLQSSAGTRTLVLCGAEQDDPATRQLLLGILQAAHSRL